MKAICVDDERILMEDTVARCLELPEIDEARGFVRPEDALEWLEHNAADLALLDIDMPGMNGIQLAAAIKAKHPDTAILFLTGYAQYAVDAFAVRASGYLLKPVTKEALAADVAYALGGKKTQTAGRVLVQTFGSFDVFVDRKPISFKMAKCKELLAYLVDKQGSGVTRAEIFSVLWEDRFYDRKMQKQLDVYIRALRETLRTWGIADMIELQKGVFRVRPETFSCDAYQFFAGDSDAVNAYRGEYMSAYSWASMTESMMYWKIADKS
jgi:two-component SAPR family response regulator